MLHFTEQQLQLNNESEYNYIKMFKGTDQSSDSDNEEALAPLIQKSMILNQQIDSNHILCSICMHIIWNPIICGSSSGCHNTFCEQCIKRWIDSSNKSCPTCKINITISSPPPILKSLLNCLVIKCCYYKNGCHQQIPYLEILEHKTSCQYSLVKCKGCRQKVIKKNYDQHVQECEQIIVKCSTCGNSMTKGIYKNHTKIDCLNIEIQSCSNRVENIEHGIEQVGSSLSKLEELTKCFLVGEPLQLNIELYTTFNQHFIFPNPTLIKPSFNQQKQKFDFLHFYILNPIYADSITSIKWGIKINKMVGNILLGFCSNMGMYSLDFIINKYGEIKRKNVNESKYKYVRKSQQEFSFHCGDILRFRYYSLSKYIKIENETKKVKMVLEEREVEQLGQQIYLFYSMDTLNDSISFL